MRRSISLLLAFGALAGTAAPAMADTAPRRAAPERAVYVCSADAATARSFERRHGSAPVFITARQAIDAASAGERWQAPRCMTEREHARYVQLSTERASVR